MLLFQALFALLRRSLGSVVKAIFGWATLALFGEVREEERTGLTVVVGAAAVWPLLLVGTVFPRQAALVLAVLPIPEGVSEEIVRAVWIALTLLVPLAVGWALQRKSGSKNSRFKKLMLGFPTTAGLGLAFLVAAIAVPLRKLVAVSSGLRDEHVALAIEPDDYNDTVSELSRALARAGFDVSPHRPPRSTRVLGAIMQKFAGAVLDIYHPKNLAYLKSEGLELTVYPNGIRLSGTKSDTARAHAIIAEAATRSPALQCMTAEGQELERRIKALVRSGGAKAERGIPSAARALAETSVDFDDWEVLFRELLQAAAGPHLLEREVKAAKPHAAAARHRRLRQMARHTREAGSRQFRRTASDQTSKLFEKLARKLVGLLVLRRRR